MVKKKSRKWIFRTLFAVGIIGTLIFIALQTNLLFKNGDFSTTISFESPNEGDSGSILLERNSKTPSVVDWVEFDNGRQVKFISSSYVEERIFINMPDIVEPGVYYFDVSIKFQSGIEETETLSFRVV